MPVRVHVRVCLCMHVCPCESGRVCMCMNSGSGCQHLCFKFMSKCVVAYAGNRGVRGYISRVCICVCLPAGGTQCRGPSLVWGALGLVGGVRQHAELPQERLLCGSKPSASADPLPVFVKVTDAAWPASLRRIKSKSTT